jgi:hypothetical protein
MKGKLIVTVKNMVLEFTDGWTDPLTMANTQTTSDMEAVDFYG